MISINLPPQIFIITIGQSGSSAFAEIINKLSVPIKGDVRHFYENFNCSK